MAALPGFTEPDGAVGDVYNGYEIVEVINAGAGRYAWEAITEFKSVADLSATAGLTNGRVFKTKGYYTAGDGGGQEVVYRSSGKSGITVDGGFYFAGPGADDYFEAVDKSVVNVQRFGATGNGTTDDTARLQSAIDFCEDNQVSSIFFPTANGEKYKLTEKLIILNGDLHLYSFGGNRVYLDGGYIFSTEEDGILIDYGNSTSNASKALTITGLALKGDPAKNQVGIKFSQSNDGPHRAVTIRDCSAVGFYAALLFDTPSDTIAPSYTDIQDCNFRENTYSILALNRMNGLRFVGNQSENGGRIKGTIIGWCEITNNLLESNKDCIELAASDACAITIRDNYFEDMHGSFLVKMGPYTNYSNSVYRVGCNYDGGASDNDTHYLVEGVATVRMERWGGVDSSSNQLLCLGQFAELLPGSIGLETGYKVDATTALRRTASTLPAVQFIGQNAPATMRDITVGSDTCLAPHGYTTTALRITSGNSGYFLTSQSGSSGDLIVVSYLVRFEDTSVPSGWNAAYCEVYNSDISADLGAGLCTGPRLALSAEWFVLTFTTVSPSAFTAVQTRLEPYLGAASGAGCTIAGVAVKVIASPDDWHSIRPMYPFV